MKIFLKLAFCVLLFSNCKQKKVQIKDSVYTIENDSIDKRKNELKRLIIEKSLRMPYSIMGYSKAKMYRQSKYFISLDSIITLYEENKLTSREKELLSIFKAKELFILSEYSEALTELEKVSSKGEFSVFKKVLQAVIYDYKGEQNNSKLLLQDVLSSFEDIEEDSERCIYYFVIKFLLNSPSYEKCSNFVVKHDLEKYDKEYLIVNYVLNDNEL